MSDHYISDNPFRLVGVGSSCIYTTLRRKGDAISKQVAVGLDHIVPLSAIFGQSELENIVASVRALATDHESRTAFRVFWPLQEESISYISGQTSLCVSNLPQPEIEQIAFLKTWLLFLENGSAHELRDTITKWEKLSTDYLFSQRLQALLYEEGLDNGQCPAEIVTATFKTVAKHIFDTAVNAAVTLGRQEDIQSSCDYLQAILSTSKYTEEAEASLSPMVQYGDSLARLILDVKIEFTWTTIAPPRQTLTLGLLASTLEGKHPSASRWEEVILQANSCLVSMWIDKAVTLVKQENKNQEALELLVRARGIPVSPAVRDRLAHNLRKLKELIAGNRNYEPDGTFANDVSVRNASYRIPWGCLAWAVLASISAISFQFSHGIAQKHIESPSLASDVPPPSDQPVPPSTNPLVAQVAPDDASNEGEYSVLSQSPQVPIIKPHDQQLEDLKAKIEKIRMQVDDLRPKIESQRRSLTSEKNRIGLEGFSLDLQKDTLDQSFSRLQTQKSTLNDLQLQSQDSVSTDFYNSEVMKYNSSLESYNSSANAYEYHRKTFNLEVDLYNAERSDFASKLHAFNAKVDQANEFARKIQEFEGH